MQKRNKLILIGLIIVLAIGVLIFWLVHRHNSQTQQAASSATTNLSQSSTANNSTTATNSTNSSTDTNKQQNPTPTDSSGQNILVAPSGNFVSNHKPNLSGQPAPNQEQSVCLTTPGATCTITFTMGQTTKSLPTKTIDSSAAVTWNWSLQDIGLTQGSWQVSATATLNGASKTTQDAISLDVSP